MVIYKLTFHDERKIQWHYWPEGNEEKMPGVIEINIEEDTISITKPAEEDFEIPVLVDDLKEMRDAINQMRVEEGRPLLKDDEFPLPENDSKCWQYGSNVLDDINNAYENGTIKETGTVAWY